MTIKCPKCNADNPDTSRFCADCGTQIVSIEDVSVTKTIQEHKVSSGKIIAGKYNILAELGRGGMGVIYKAKDTRLDRTVALKFLPPELAKDEQAKQRFVQEAKAAAALEHPNICTVYEVDEADEQTFIAMSYIEGQSLKDKLQDGPMDVDKAKDIALQVAEGLGEAHKKGIVHRDIKPANIMLTDKGQAKITDFGLAKLSWGADLTQPSTIMGTVAYMSPEQAKGEEVDHRTDIWSLGAIFYEMLTGERPFKKDKEQALIYAILNDKPTPISLLRSDIPSRLEYVIEKAMAKKTSERYQGIQGLIQDLKEAPLTTLPKTEKSIAVLPFTNMSADPDQEYFCDGITEEIINALTHIAELKVIARTSSFMFKGKHEDIREIGKRLDVRHILEGSVRKAGNRLRITAQLINVGDGSHLWSEKYDRDMEDVFDIQDEISLAIVDKLKIKLLRREKESIAKRYTEDVEAYNLYLKGMHFTYMFTAKGFEEANECFKKALQKDPKYALAYCGLANIIISSTFFGNVSPPEGYPKAKEYIQKALEIDDTLPEAHAFLGYILAFYGWNWKEAEIEFKKALELNSNYADGHSFYTEFLMLTERHEEAISEAKRAQELDTLSIYVNGTAGHAFFYAGEYDRAVEEYRTGLKIDRDHFGLHLFLGYCFFQKSMFEEAIAEFEKAVELSGHVPMCVCSLATTYYEIGKKVEADQLFENLKKRSRDEYVPPIWLFFVYLVQDEKDKALEWLERACKEHDSFLLWMRVFPVDLFRIPDEPEFQELLKKYGLG